VPDVQSTESAGVEVDATSPAPAVAVAIAKTAATKTTRITNSLGVGGISRADAKFGNVSRVCEFAFIAADAA